MLSPTEGELLLRIHVVDLTSFGGVSGMNVVTTRSMSPCSRSR